VQEAKIGKELMARPPKQRTDQSGVQATPKQLKYVKGVLEGKYKGEAALEAGYSESSARNPKGNIEGPAVRAIFQKAMRDAIPLYIFVQRMREGVDAQVIKYFAHEGVVTDSRTDVDLEQRRRYLEDVAKWAGYFVEKAEIDVNDSTTDPEQRVRELVALGLARIAESSQASRADGTQEPSQG